MFPHWAATALAAIFLAASAATLLAKRPVSTEQQRVASLYRMGCMSLVPAAIALLLGKHAASVNGNGFGTAAGLLLGLFGLGCVLAAWRGSRVNSRDLRRQADQGPTA